MSTPTEYDARHLNLGEAPREVEEQRQRYRDMIEEAGEQASRACRAEADLEQLLEAVRTYRAAFEHGGEREATWPLLAVADEIEIDIENRRKR